MFAKQPEEILKELLLGSRHYFNFRNRPLPLQQMCQVFTAIDLRARRAAAS